MMRGWEHGDDFSLDAEVWVPSCDRAGLERLIRYRARPVFAGERPAWLEPDQRLVYRLPKPRPGGQTALYLTPLAFLDCIAALVPPPRKHQHRYHGVLAPNSPLRPTVTAYAGLPIDIPAGQPTAPARPFPPDAATAETHPLRTRAILGRADRLRHRTGTGATHPSPYRRSRHTPPISPARSPPVGYAFDWDHPPGQDPEAGEPAPEFQFDQTVSW